MRKALTTAVIVVVVFAFAASSAPAGGVKVRGEKGQSAVNQAQVQDPPPFQP